MSKITREWQVVHAMPEDNLDLPIRQVYTWIFTRDKQVVIVSKDGERWQLPGAKPDRSENALETAVREVQEESGVPLEDVRYVASQPWPFPRSLMLGFRARLATGADPEALHPDPTEISELRWFSRDELSHPSPELKLPRKLSIARALIDLWVREGDSEQ